MASTKKPAAPTTCPVLMSDGQSCRRPIHPAPAGVDSEPVCLMHSRDPNKDKAQFRQEIDAILNGTSAYHRPKDKFDFTRFSFPEADFMVAEFTKEALFTGATFTQNAIFFGATFTQNANFAGAIFSHLADFSMARFEQPARVRFYQVNRESPQRLRARLVNCEVEGVHFEDVRWYREQGEKGRMVLMDELDIRESRQEEKQREPAPRHELVAIAYRRLINNFDRVRAYDLAEDCSIGAMEMKRLDPAQPFFMRAVVTLYRGASYYGSSYTRALLVLLFLVIVFGVAFALSWAGLVEAGTESTVAPSTFNPWVKSLKDILAGLLHSLEVATFQRDPLYATKTPFGRVVTALETALVPAQLALLLLVLRRRFRR